jgi:hypothetical protein
MTSVPNTDNQPQKIRNLMTTAVTLAQFWHNLIDSKIDPNITNWYHDHFCGGVDPYNCQTDNCLIIEEYYGIPMSTIHTPLGEWSVSGSGIGHLEILKKHLHDNAELKMICPGHQTESRYYGPYWLVTSFQNHPIPHPDMELLPPHDRIDVTDRSQNKSQNKGETPFEPLQWHW